MDLSQFRPGPPGPGGAGGGAAKPVPAPAAVPAAPVNPVVEMTRQLTDLTALTRQLVDLNREQVELSRRAEQRFLEQQKNQRDEWQRWAEDYKHLRGRTKGAEESVRSVLARSVTELVEYLEEHGDQLNDSEFLQREMSEKFGVMLHHLGMIQGTLRRLTSVEQEQAGAKPSGT